MKLSIIIPCYNEESTILKIIEKINSLNDYHKEIIVIDDFSTDKSLEILEKLLVENKIQKLLKNDKNEGKGFSLKKGIDVANGNIILFQDADLEYDPKDYHKLLKPILNNHADVVFGTRFAGSEVKRVLFFWHSFGNWILTNLSNMLSNINLTDMENCYKVFRSDIIKSIQLNEKRFGIEPEIVAKISKIKKIRIYEVSVKYYGRTYEEGKKITWKDGFSALRCILLYNLFDK
jgi:glycosyltransferase involved in cell wall biosynthesis